MPTPNHFRDEQAPTASEIREMFDRLAPRYDLFNHLTSAGLAVLWRRRALSFLKPGMRVLDLGCGTGDLSLQAATALAGTGSVTGVDFSEAMLQIARKRAAQVRPPVVRPGFVRARAEELPLPGDGPYDAVVSGFVLRNLYEHIDAILPRVRRCLKPGGVIRFLDITEPHSAPVRAFWKAYMSTAVALYGRVLFGKAYPMFYLTQSAARFPGAAEFSKKLSQAGFIEVRACSLWAGMITLYEAAVPSQERGTSHPAGAASAGARRS